MVQNVSTLPATFPEYFDGGDVGILQNQTMFAYDSSLDGLWDARASFCGMLNNILISNAITYDRPEAVAAMDATTPIDEYLVWRRASGTRYIEPIPPQTLWDYQVFSLEERNSLLIDPIINTDLANGQTVRVLVNGLANQQSPQWSVYVANATILPIVNALTIAENPTTVFTLVKSYDYSVADMNSRNLLITAPDPIQVGQYVYVSPTIDNNNFWTVWQYFGPNTGRTDLDNNNFKLVRYQTYDTSDFWSYNDWYANGYVSTSPPVVVYATAAARNTAENPNPKNTFVKISNDGTGKWNWTAYENGVWTVVARQSGTIQFSSKFYDYTTRPRIGFDPINLSDIANIPNRDGCWEFRVLFNMLQDVPILEDIELNQLFFSMLHFIHTQQDQVDWAFKTSFMNIGGYNEQLLQDPIQPIDNITNLTNYITEIKPYRVVIRNFDQILTPPIDNALVHATDFDFPLYYDANTAIYRYLDLNNPSDLAIIQTTAPWSDWYNNYNRPEYRPANYNPATWNPVRHMIIKQFYDRIDHMPIVYEELFEYSNNGAFPDFGFTLNTFFADLTNYIVDVFVAGEKLLNSQYSSSLQTVYLYVEPNVGDPVEIIVRQNLTANAAADRIQMFYQPTNAALAEKNLRQLMGLDFKANILDGGNLANSINRDYDVDGNYSGASTDESLNPNVAYYGLRDPAIDKDRPEELVFAHPNESLNMFIIEPYNANTITDFAEALDNSILGNSLVFSQAIPTPDLMTPLNTGDYDARPLDVIVLDVGTTPTHANANVTTYTNVLYFSNGAIESYIQNNTIVDRELFVFRNNAWDQKLWPAPGATLLEDVYSDGQSLLIQPTVSGTFPFTPPTVEYVAQYSNPDGTTYTLLPTDTANASINANNAATNLTYTQVVSKITKPGAVWLNKERIEYFDYAVNANGTVTLSQLRRGSRSTRISYEQRKVVTYIGDGLLNGTGTSTFEFPNETSPTNLEVYLYEVPTNPITNAPITATGYQYTDANGIVSYKDHYTGYPILVPKKQGTDYVTNVVANGLAITFSTPPLANVSIYICKTDGVYHPTGSLIYDALLGYYGQTPPPPPPVEVLQWYTAPSSTIALANVGSGAVPSNLNILATDSLGYPITYTQVGGSLPTGLTLNSDGTITGTVANVSIDTSYLFSANAATNSAVINGTFLINVTAPDVVTWITGANIGTFSDITSYTLQLVATENNNLPIIYELSNASAGVSVSNNGLFTATIPSLTFPNTSVITFTVNAVAQGSDFTVSNAQTFNMTVEALSPLFECSRESTDGQLTNLNNLSVGINIFNQPLTYTGTVPYGMVAINAKLWGAASAGGSYHDGGSGGFTNVLVPVNYGDSIKVEIGKTGAPGIRNDGVDFDPEYPQFYPGDGGWPDGGYGGGYVGVGGFGGGGGSTRLWINNVLVAVAGGAGGVENDLSTDQQPYTHGGGYGGDGTSNYSGETGGDGGNQTTGGTIQFISNNSAYPNHQGAYLQGGTGYETSNSDITAGSGGGGGYYGGGAGLSGYGGGGSGYINNNVVASGTTVNGPFVQDLDYPGTFDITNTFAPSGNISLGGLASGSLNYPGDCGGNGYAVIKVYANSYVAPAVLSKPKVIFSTRLANYEYSGPILEIKRSSDNTKMNIGYVLNTVASPYTYDLDTAAIANFCGTSMGYVSTWYDQSGNGFDARAIQGGESGNCNPPLIYDGTTILTLNGRPSLQFNSANSNILSFGYAFYTGAFTLASVLQMNSASVGKAEALAVTELANGNPLGTYIDSANKPGISNNFDSLAYSSATPIGLTPSFVAYTSNYGITPIGGSILADVVYNSNSSTASEFTLNGVDCYPTMNYFNSSDSPIGAQYVGTNIGSWFNGSAYYHGLYYLDANVSEMIYWDDPLASGDLSAYQAVINTYYGL